MEEFIGKIVKNNKSFFGAYPKIHKINIGFTNTLYNINDSYIVKVCTDINNELKFKKEIDFYNANKENNLIPKLYYSNISKDDIPYYYEILEKINGVTLYDVWHILDESQREEIIKQLCDAMKQFHSVKGQNYDWAKKTSDLFIELYNKAKSLNIFNENEIKLLDKSYSKFNEYLQSNNKIVLIHNDLHFDNILYNDGKVKLIDFERSIYAPKDFELDILYRMIRKPWKFASEENEQYTKLSDYENIMTYIEKYYSGLIYIDNLYKRLAIYDIVYYLKQYINHPEIIKLKDDILNAANIVLDIELEKRYYN